MGAKFGGAFFRNAEGGCTIDFVELRRGAAKELETQLRKSNAREEIHTDPIDAGDDPRQRAGRGHMFAQSWKSFVGLFGMLPSPTIPQNHRKPQLDIELGLCPSAADVLDSDHNFVLLCVPFQR